MLGFLGHVSRGLAMAKGNLCPHQLCFSFFFNVQSLFMSQQKGFTAFKIKYGVLIMLYDKMFSLFFLIINLANL